MNEIFEKLNDQLGLFNAMYDIIRIVDPVKKIAYSNDGTSENVVHSVCYQNWNRGVPCDNCISMRALETNKATTKIEIKGNTVYLIQAIPVVVDNQRYVVEILKDVTADRIFYLDDSQPGNLTDYITKINSQLIIDELTDIYNRRYIEERFPSDLSQIGHHSQGMVMVVGDIDHFKAVNDNYGHLAGDYVLHEVARIIKESIRESSDWVARYGGEEFLVVFNNIKADKSLEIIETIRESIAAYDFVFDGALIKVTCSFGLVAINESNRSFGELFKVADANIVSGQKNKVAIKV